MEGTSSPVTSWLDQHAAQSCGVSQKRAAIEKIPRGAGATDMTNDVLSGSAFETVAEAYNRNADKYDDFIEHNPNLMRMRQKVYSHVTSLLPTGSRILDLACGTGTD